MNIINLIGEACEVLYMLACLAVFPAYLASALRPQAKEARWFKVCGQIWQAVWPLGLPAIVSSLLDNQADGNWLGMLLNAFSLWGWWMLRDFPEDNHWKRRAKKISETVKSIGHRLAVVPAGAQ